VRGLRVLIVVSSVAAAGCGRGAPSAGTLRVLTQFPAASADPQQSDDNWTQALLANVYDPLVRLDAAGTLQPALATSWTNPDARTFRLELRPDVRFHDGWRFTAADVAWTIERGVAAPDSWIRSVAPALEGVTVRGPLTVELRTREPAALLLHQLAVVLVMARGHATDQPVGTGPYRVVRFRPEEVELARFDGYWGGRPRWAGAEFRWEPDAAKRTQAVRSGAADLAEVPPGGALDALAGDPSVRLILNRVPRLAVLGLRAVGDSPFADAARRALLAHRIDRGALSKIVDGGRSLQATQLAPPGIFGTPSEPGDPAGALAAQTLPIVPAPLLYSGARNGALAHGLASQSVTTRVAFEPLELPAAELDRRLAAGDVTAFVVQLTYPNLDASDFLSWGFHTRTPDGRWGAGNVTGYSDAAADAAIQAAERELDPRKRGPLLRRVMADAAAAHVWIPLVVPPGFHLARPGLAWDESASGRVRLEEIRPEEE
jgi:peptide/nickel transport system substrate-binding protein